MPFEKISKPTDLRHASVLDGVLPSSDELVIDAKTGRVRQAGATLDEGPWVIDFRARAEQSLYVFTKAVLKRELLSPNLHGWLCRSLVPTTHNRMMRLLPRGHLKSSVVSEALPMHMHIQPDPDQGDNLYWKGVPGSEMNVILCGEKKDLMGAHLRWIETQWESNDLLRALWPHRCWNIPRRDSKKWNEEEMIIPRARDYADPSLRVIGVDGAITGAHCRVLVKDDLISVAAANSPTVMQSAINGHIASRALLAPFEDVGLEYIIGCLPTDAEVLMGDGTKKSISDVKEGETVWASDTDGSLQKRPVVAKIYQGISELLTIRTSSKVLKATPNHPFLVRRKREFEWTRADALAVGDFIVAIKSVPGELVHPWMSEEFFWLFGFLLGDGWVNARPRRGYVCVALSKDDDLNERVVRATEDWLHVTLYRTPFGYMRCDSNSAADGLAALGFSGGAKTKRVPSWVFQAPPEYRCAFLLGFCEADGHHDVKCEDMWSVEISNRGLMEDLRHVASLCGVRTGTLRSRTRLIEAPNSPEPVLNECWGSSFNFATVGRCEMYHGSFRFDCSLGIRQERVESIERATIEEPVYDLTVGGTPSFFANGLAVHNTRWAASDLYDYIQRNDDTVNVKVRSIIEDGAPIWPEQITLEHIAALKKEYGVLFMLLYMNSTAHPDLTDFEVTQLREFVFEGTDLTFNDDARDATLAEREREPIAPSPDALRGVKMTPAVRDQLMSGSRHEYFRLKAR